MERMEYVRPDLIPVNEEGRMKTLLECQILNDCFSDEYEEDFNRYTSFAKKIFNAPTSMVVIVYSEKVWVKSHETDIKQLHRNLSFCSHVILPECEKVLVVEDATKNPKFCDSPMVNGELSSLRFYASTALIVDGYKIGALCIVDDVPRKFDEINQSILVELADATSSLIAARRDKFLQNEAQKLLLHNIRTPLTSLNCGLHMISEDISQESAGSDKSIKHFNTVMEDITKSVNELNVSLGHKIEFHISSPNQPAKCADISNDSTTGSNALAVTNGQRSKQLSRANSHNDFLSTEVVTREEIRYFDTAYAKSPRSPSSPQDVNSAYAAETRNKDIGSFSPVDKKLDSQIVRVLLIEDSVMIQKVMRKWLESSGCEVHSAVNGLLGLNKLKSERFDITITDFLMPEMGGIDCLQYYSEWLSDSNSSFHQNSNMLIVGMSATADNDEIQQAFQYGMHCFSSKPVDMQLLKTCISLKKNCANLAQCLAAMSSSGGITPVTTPLNSPRPAENYSPRQQLADKGSKKENNTSDLGIACNENETSALSPAFRLKIPPTRRSQIVSTTSILSNSISGSSGSSASDKSSGHSGDSSASKNSSSNSSKSAGSAGPLRLATSSSVDYSNGNMKQSYNHDENVSKNTESINNDKNSNNASSNVANANTPPDTSSVSENESPSRKTRFSFLGKWHFPSSSRSSQKVSPSLKYRDL